MNYSNERKSTLSGRRPYLTKEAVVAEGHYSLSCALYPWISMIHGCDAAYINLDLPE